MLELQDYVFVASKMLSRLGGLTWRFALKFWFLIAPALALAAASIYFIVEDPNAAHVAAGIGGVVASLGLTWKGVGASPGENRCEC
jgi:hypothetical protein